MPSPILPFKGPSMGGIPSRPSVGVPRAQDLSVSKLQPKIEREQAAVSMSQVMNRRAGIENSRSTSITHIGQTSAAPSTSITHAGVERSYSNQGQSDSAADDRRYAYMRKMIKERQAKEAEAVKKQMATSSKEGFDVDTGKTLRTSGAGSLHKKLTKEFRTHRTKYSGLTGEDKKVLESTLTGTLSKKVTGSAINRFDRKKMKQQINKAHDAGDVSLGHAKKLKKFIDKIH